MLRGYNDYEIAKAINVRRETICRWRNQDATFRALLQKKRAEMLDLSAAQLQGMAEQATQVVLRAIHSSNQSDARLAMSLLEKLGVFERGRGLEREELAPVWAGEVREMTEDEAFDANLDAVEASVESKALKLGVGAMDGGQEPRVRAARGANGRFVSKRE